MAQETSNAVLRRKAHAAREVWQARAMSPAKAWKLAFARAADDLMDLAVAVARVEEDTTGAEAMVEALEEGELLLLLDGPDGAIGVASLAFPVVAGLVEMLTMGRVLRGPLEPRRPTQTDAAMIAPLLDQAFANFGELLEDRRDAEALFGFRFGVQLENPRMVGLAIEATDFHRFRMTFDLAGMRDGAVTLALPVRDVQPPQAEEEGAEGGHPVPLSPAVLKARARLDAVLHRVRMPLSEVMRLRPGDVIPVPRSALTDTVLEAGPRHRVAEVRLGQMNGYRAVRLSPAEGALAAGVAGARGMADPTQAEGATLSDLPPAGSDPAPMPDLPEMEDLPGLGELPPLDLSEDASDLPALDDLPPLGDLPELGGLSFGDDEAEGEEDGFGAAPMAGLPPLE